MADCLLIFFFKQKTAYDMRISDWSSDVCSSDLDVSRGACCSKAAALGASSAHMGLLDPTPPPYDPLEWEREPFTERVRQACQAWAVQGRSEERRVGKECVSTCSSRWSPYP